MKLPVDNKIRKEIRTNFRDNLFITAGAGTGKTQSIVDRVAAAICDEKIAPEKIAVTTFTEKAANELAFKIRRILEEKAPEKARAVHNMFIGTNHSFCMTMLKERPLETKIVPDAEILIEDDSNQKIEKIGRNIINEYFSKPENETLYMNWDFDPFSGVDFFKTLYKYRELTPVNPEKPKMKKKNFWENYEKAFKEVPKLLEMNESDDPDGYDWLIKELKNWKNLKEKSIDDIFHYFINLQLFSPRKTSWTNVKLRGNRSKSLANYVFEPFESVQNDIFSYIAYELYKTFKRLYSKFEKEYQEWKTERGVLDFSDMLLMAKKLLRNSKDVREYFQQRFDLIIVDEFQDTDPIMCEIIMYICQDGQEDVSWNQVGLKPGKLTVVGDEKQSIYRFRRADISVYNRVRKLFENEGKILTLSQNFRSVTSLVSSNNHAFENIFKKDNGTDKISYNKINSFRGKGVCPAKKNLIFLGLDVDLSTDTDERKKNGELRADFLREREAAAVCDWIKQAVEKKNLKINGKTAGYGDFLLLFRNRKAMHLYARDLAKKEIPVAMDGEGFLLELPEVIDFFRLLKGCIQSDDSVAIVAALRSAFLGISDRDLYNHKMKQGDFNFFAIKSDRGDSNVNSALDRMKKYHFLLTGKNPVVGFYNVLHQERIKNVLAQTRRGIGFNVYDSLLSFIGDCCDSAASPADAINTVWENISAGTSLDPSFYPFKKRREVQMMTIHKAKGLESPVVILCDVTASEIIRVNHIFDRSTENLFFKFGVKPRSYYRNAEYLPGDKYSVTSKGFELFKNYEILAAQEESLRLIYVAATRSGDYLIIPSYRGSAAPFYSKLQAYYKEKKQFSVKKATLSAGYGNDTALPLPDVQPIKQKKKDAGKINADVERLNKSRENILTTIDKSSKPVMEKQAFSHEKALKRESAGYGAEYGILFHRIMEIIVKSLGSFGKIDVKQFEDLSVKNYGKIISNAVYESGFELTPESRTILDRHINKVMNSDLFKECMNADTRFAEFQIALMEEKKDVEIFKSGIIDLVYKNNDEWKVIDYKTDRIQNNESKNTLITFYSEQLDDYINALSMITGEKVVGELLFVDE